MDGIRRLFRKSNKMTGGSVIKKYTPVENAPELGCSSAPREWQKLRENHYKKWLGDSEKAIVWHEVVPYIPHIDIHVFPPAKELGRNYFTLITSGMSDEKMILPQNADEQFARAELIFYVADAETRAYQTEKPWYVKAMFFYAHFPFTYKTWFGFFHTLPNGDPPAPVVEGSSLTTAFFLPALFESKEFKRTLQLGDKKVTLLWLTYLSDKETEYKLKYGFEKLMDRFNKDNFPQVFNPLRKSVI